MRGVARRGFGEVVPGCEAVEAAYERPKPERRRFEGRPGDVGGTHRVLRTETDSLTQLPLPFVSSLLSELPTVHDRHCQFRRASLRRVAPAAPSLSLAGLR